MLLTGYVVDANRNPIPGATVAILDDMGSFPGINTTTDSTGSYYLNDARIDPANDQLYVNANGYPQTAFPLQSGYLQMQKTGSASTTNQTVTTIQQGAGFLTDLLKIFTPKPAPTPYPSPYYPIQQQPSMSGLILPGLLLVGAIILIKKKKRK